MRHLFLFAALATALAGCATTKVDKPPICDGRHRRPANLYGSVIVPDQPPGATSPISPGPAAPDADPGVKPQSLSNLPTGHGSCA